MVTTLKDCLLDGGIKRHIFHHHYYINEERGGNENSFKYQVIGLSFIPPNMTEVSGGKYRESKKGESILDQGRLEILREGNKLSEVVDLSRYSGDQLIQ
ncbi:hypothetical protein HY212_07195 [Candidatus Pacearchaeota archaeon]|nr:hypothetical protein [Candidatus Pacearchaeota archaeon]